MANKTAKRAQPAKKQQPRPKSRKQASRPVGPSWLSAVLNPWNHAPTGVPDEFTQPSLKYESRITQLYTTADYATVPTHNHGLLIGVGPYLTPTVGGVAGCGSIATRGFDSSTVSYTGDVAVSQMPNVAAMFPAVTTGSTSTTYGYQYRVSAMSAKLTYLGMEVSRAGRIAAGLASPIDLSNAVQASAIPVNPLAMTYGTTVTGGATQAVQSVRNKFRRITTVRNPDGSVEVRWIPTGVPRYCPLIQSTAAQINDYADLGPNIIFAIEGDMTGPLGSSGATSAGNSYQLDVIMHIEVIPLSRYALAIGPTPSPYDPAALSACLNKFETITAVSEWDGGMHFNVDDGAQASSGSAWEYIGNVGNALGRGMASTLNTAGMVLNHPATRLITANMARRRMRNYQPMLVD